MYKPSILQHKLPHESSSPIHCYSNLQRQSAETAAEVKQEYENLHTILREEEAARLLVLQNERDSKTEAVREKLEEVNKSIEELSDIIDYIEPIIIADDLTFLKVNMLLNHYFYLKVLWVML